MLEVLVFEVGGQRHGLPAVAVRELLRAVAITPLPEAPADVAGVINLRGRVVPILDVRSRLKLPLKPLAPSDHFVVIEVAERLQVLRVDRALDFVRLGEAECENVQALVPAAAASARVARVADQIVLIHDPVSFFSWNNDSALTQALSEPRQPQQEKRAS